MKATVLIIILVAVIYAPVSIYVFGNSLETIFERAFFMLVGGMTPFLLMRE